MQSSIVHKLFALMSVVSAAQSPLTFSEIVDKTGLNKSTVHRLLAVGLEERVLRYEAQSKVYLLGPRVFDLVRNAYRGYDIQEIALDQMIRLHGLVDANVAIGVPAGDEVVYLRVLEATQFVGVVQQPRLRGPMHCSASGKALWAFLPESVLEARLKAYTFTRFTERTITTAAGFREAAAFVRAHGYGCNDREEYDHYLGISAPIFNYLSEPIAVLNIWSAYPRHKMEDLMGWSDELMRSAQHVTDMIGGLVPKTYATARI